ncbi:cytochrome c oxidase assembly protein COX18, mitochondrial [Osmia bicornis bicornis]|uniref:cytochrome c oxidase assembly protein COX18, mitochondrial n=1 Tax=Osmia bicornis bicornis TaxID=1437191 RepID=UPI001EAF8C75|nr:cytochrome c oxidase assembly protein COX18, mitochondrial [Osmia bicornis bicornis]
MITRIFQRTILNIQYSNSIFVKYFHHSHNASIHESIFLKSKTLGYFLNEDNFPKKQNISLHQSMYNNVSKGPLLCKSTPILASTILMKQSFITNSVRHYSNTAPAIINQTMTYNNGIWKAISESFPVECLTNVLKIMHDQTGLPWWATIVVTTIIMRMFINLPLTIHDYQIKAKIENIKNELEETAKKLKMEIRMNMMNSEWTPVQAKAAFMRAIHEERTFLYQRDNCHPIKSVVMIILQAPVWISFSFSLRNICYMLPDRDEAAYQTYLQFISGGFGWITDLTAGDPTFILPVIFGISGLALIEMNQMLHKQHETKFARYYRNFLRVLTVFFMSIAAYLPSCLTLFWTTHNCLAVLQTLLLMSPKFRRLGRIPKTESEYPHPYSELYKSLKLKVGLK